MLAGGASAQAGSSIEGIWAFESGQIAIQAQSGTFLGVVVQETKLTECVHPVGQEIWTALIPQSDGSYWGLHQWYFEGCEENPERGRAAFRVFEEPGGSRYLLVCLSYPGNSEQQPTIAADGVTEHASYGCIRSTLTASLPSASGSSPGGSTTATGLKPGIPDELERLSLPSAKKCVSMRPFQIRLVEPKYDPFKTVLVTVKGHKLATTRHGSDVVATIGLPNLKHGRFTVTIHATTVLGHHLSASRTYRTCARKTKKAA